MLEFERVWSVRESPLASLSSDESAQSLLMHEQIDVGDSKKIKYRRFCRQISSDLLSNVRKSLVDTIDGEETSTHQNILSLINLQTNGEENPKIVSKIIDICLGGALIISREIQHQDQVSKVLLELFDPITKDQKKLLELSDSKQIVSASINHSQTLLAFTTRELTKHADFTGNEDRSVDSSAQELYQPWIAEINPQGRIFPLSTFLSKEMTRIQFYTKDSSKSSSSYLVFHGCQNISLYKATCQKKLVGHELSVANPNLFVRELASNLLWFQWDPIDGLLFLIYKHHKHKDQNEFVLRCFDVGNGKLDRPALDTVLKMKNASSLQTIDVQSPKKLYKIHPQHYTDGTVYLQAVRMKNRGLCLCQYDVINEADDQTSILQIYLYVIHDQCLIEFQLPLPNPTPGSERPLSVFFGNLNDMLMVFIPGTIFHLIDCGHLHEPCSSVLVDIADFIPSVPSAASLNPQIIFLPSADFDNRQPVLVGNRMIDMENGEIYNYQISRTSLIELAQHSSFHQHAFLLHMMSFHLQDSALIQKTLAYLCSTGAAHFTSTAMEEYVVSTIARRMGDGSDRMAIFQSCILATIFAARSRQLIEGSESTYTVLQSPIISPVNNSDIVFQRYRNVTWPQLVKIVREKLYLHHKLSQIMISGDSSSGKLQPRVGMRSLMGRLFVTSNHPDNVFITPDESKQDLENHSNLIEHIRLYFQSLNMSCGREQCDQGARFYFQLQAECCNSLYQMISDYYPTQSYRRKVPDGSLANSFLLYESLYYVLESLGFPYPHDFHNRFCITGFRHLPPTVFTQYLERGVFKLHYSCLNEILGGLGTSDEEMALRNRVLSRLSTEDFVNYYQKFRSSKDARYVMEHILSLTSVQSQPEIDLYEIVGKHLDENMESSNSLETSAIAEQTQRAAQPLIAPERLLPLSIYISTLESQPLEITWHSSQDTAATNLTHSTNRRLLALQRPPISTSMQTALDVEYIADAARVVSKRALDRHAVTQTGTWFVPSLVDGANHLSSSSQQLDSS